MYAADVPSRVVLVALLGSLASSCESSNVDPSDLRSVFDGSARSTTSATASPRPSPSAKASAVASLAPPVVREPPDARCFTPTGSATPVRRVEGRPACRGAEVMEWREASGDPRYGCLYASAEVLAQKPVPIVLFFHGTGPALDDPSSLTKLTSLRELASSTRISPDKPGFAILGVQGRNFGASTNGFDLAHVAAENQDVLATDKFLERLEERGLVDRARVYTFGLGQGGTFALSYATIRADRVAAASAFAPLPGAASWECPTPPPPAWLLYRACDAIAPCAGLESWAERRGGDTQLIRVGDDAKAEPACATRNKCTPKRATANHHRFPKGREKELLRFFSSHTLRAH